MYRQNEVMLTSYGLQEVYTVKLSEKEKIARNTTRKCSRLMAYKKYIQLNFQKRRGELEIANISFIVG